jgi:hypothetical protein
MQRASITYERCSEGLERKADKYQNVLISNIPTYIKDTVDGTMFYHDVENIPDFALRSLILSHGTFAHAATPIYNKEKNLVGIVSLDWVFSEISNDYLTEGQFNQTFKDLFKTESSSLSSYL